MEKILLKIKHNSLYISPCKENEIPLLKKDIQSFFVIDVKIYISHFLMTPEIPPLLLILKQACKKYGYTRKLIDTYSNNLVEVSDGEKSFFASNTKVWAYPLNSNFSAQIASDKARTYKILQQKWYSIPHGEYFFVKEKYRELRGERRELNDALAYAQGKYPVFVKPNSSSLGTLAEIVYNEQELVQHLHDISQISYIALIQEVINLPEYRIFAIDGKIAFLYQKTKTAIIGDSTSSIKELITKTNQSIKREYNKITLDNAFLQQQLQQHKLSPESILAEGQQLTIAQKANISSWGMIQNYTEQLSKKTQERVQQVMKDIGIRVCGIDIFTKNGIDHPENFITIEINSAPSLVGIYELGQEQKALEIRGKICEKYFKEL